jgi:hypothetical protein
MSLDVEVAAFGTGGEGGGGGVGSYIACFTAGKSTELYALLCRFPPTVLLEPRTTSMRHDPRRRRLPMPCSFTMLFVALVDPKLG